MQIKQTPLEAVYFSRFIHNDKGHGGTRRAFQVLNIIQNYNPRFISAPEKNYADEPLNIPEIKFGDLKLNDLEFKQIITGEEYFHWSEKFRNAVMDLRLIAHKWAGIISTKLPVDIAFVDEPFFFSPLIDRLNELNIPVIGLEHNIETLVRGQVEEKHQHELFKKEIEYFKKCALVITISHEDTVVLNNFGVNTLLLPYYPINEQKELFLNIREGRATYQDKKDYIMLGTAHNIPTLEGMFDLAEKWAKAQELKNKTLYIAGYGTGKIGELLGASINENIKIMGEVDDDTLHALLKQVKASIIFQTSATGALTRIMELLIADVPVYANHHAARSYHNIQGVIEYHDFLDLISILIEDESKELTIDIPIPDPPRNDFFLRAIDGIITEGTTKRAKEDYRLIIQNQSNIIRELQLRAERAEELFVTLQSEMDGLRQHLDVILHQQKEIDLLLQQKDHQIQETRNSYSFKIGNKIILPLSILKKLVLKLK